MAEYSGRVAAGAQLRGHTFWCERTRLDSADVECTCNDPRTLRLCRCGHLFVDHLGNGGFCRHCTAHSVGIELSCLLYREGAPMSIPAF